MSAGARSHWVGCALTSMIVCAASALHGQEAPPRTPDPRIDTRTDVRAQTSDTPDEAAETFTRDPGQEDGLPGVLREVEIGGRRVRRFTWSAETGYDDHLANTILPVTSQHATGGTWQAGQASVRFADRVNRATLTVGMSAKGRSYPNLTALNGIDADADIGLSAPMGRRSTFLLLQRARYLPYYDFSLSRVTPFDVQAARSDTSVLTARNSISYEGHIGITQNLSTRSSFAADYGYRHMRIAQIPGLSSWQLATTRLGRRVGRNGGLRVGYGFGHSQDALNVALGRTITHTLDAGGDYVRPLSRSRNARFTFGSGATLAEYQNVQRSYLVVNAAISHDVTSIWSLGGGYQQGVSFAEGLGGPLYSRTVQGRLGGALTSRLGVAVRGDYGRGAAGFAPTGNGYSTRSLAGDLSVTLHRRLSLVAHYEYYQYRFDNGIALPFSLGSVLHRQSVRIGFSGSF